MQYIIIESESHLAFSIKCDEYRDMGYTPQFGISVTYIGNDDDDNPRILYSQQWGIVLEK